MRIPSLIALLTAGLVATTLVANDDVDRNFSDPAVAALVRAAGVNDASTVMRLAKAGVDPNAVGSGGLTAISWAIGQRAEAGVQALLDAGVSPDVCPPKVGCLVGVAAQGKYPWLLKLLLRNHADPNKKNAGGEPPLYLAVLSHQKPNVEILLDAGADINLPNAANTTPVLLAAMLNRFELAAYLIDRGADYTRKNKSGNSVATLVHTREIGADAPGYRYQQELRARLPAPADGGSPK